MGLPRSLAEDAAHRRTNLRGPVLTSVLSVAVLANTVCRLCSFTFIGQEIEYLW